MKKLISLFFLIILFAPSTAVLAQEPVAFDFPSPESHDIAGYINSFYNTAVLIAGIVAVAMIVIGAIYYTVSGGSQDKQREGKNIITSAIWGVVLLLGAYVILNTINPELVSLRFGAPELDLTVDICKPADERDECTLEEESDPEDNNCCIPFTRGPTGLTMTVCSTVLEGCATEEQVIPDDESWSGQITWCGLNNPVRSCEDTWHWKNITINGPGAYVQWVFYPEELEVTTENMKCIIYALKGKVEGFAYGMSNYTGQEKIFEDWQPTDRDDLKACPGGG